MFCEHCKQEFDYPDFACKKRPGAHIVAAKTYYHGGSGNIVNIRDRRKYSPLVFLRAEDTSRDDKGKVIVLPALSVQFNDARYTTDNPEEQFFLELNGPQHKISWGPEGEAIWRKNQLTEPQQTELAKAELAALERKVREHSDLLSSVKSQAKPAPAKADKAF